MAVVVTVVSVEYANIGYMGGGSPPSPTTTPGGVVTITGGPNATANIPGPHSDPADLFGIVLGLAAIFLAIALTRLIFRTRRGSGPKSTEQAAPRPDEPAQEEPGRS